MLSRAWGVLAPFFTAQAVIQLASALAGLLFVNILPVREFALYTIATSVVTFFTFVTDLGSTGSLFFFFRHASERGLRFQPYVRAVRSLRRGSLLVGGGVLAVALPPWLAGSGFPVTAALLTTLLAMVTVHYQIEAALGVTRLRLLGLFGPAYRAEVAGAALRLALAVLVAVGGLRTGVLALATGAFAAATSALLCRHSLARVEEATLVSVAVERREILRYLAPALPSALHFALQAPLLVWLAATFGGTSNVAEVGALGRLGMLLAIFSALTPTVFLVRLARVADPRLYRRRFLQFGGALAGVGVALVLAGAMAPGALLWLLGPHYRGLRVELTIALTTAAATLLGGYAVSVVASRSWFRLQPAATGLLVAAQVGAALALRLDTTRGVLLFGLVSAAVGLGVQLVVLALGFARPGLVYNRPDRSA